MEFKDTIASLDAIHFRATLQEDLPLILELECNPENAPFIGQWSEQQHREAIESEGMAHWTILAEAEGQSVGYLILDGIGSANRSIEFIRLVIAEKGKGYGRAALKLVKQAAFERFNAHRLWLDVMEHNARARNLYRSEGFKEEGTLRECMRVGDGFVSLVVLSMLANEYRASRQPES